MSEATINGDTGAEAAARPTARLYRMVMSGHTCPYGLKAKDLLARSGFEVEDHPLATREATDRFKAQHEVSTTPQIWIGEERIGGYDALRAHLGQSVREKGATTYQPVIAIFAMAFAMALAVSWLTLGTVAPVRTVEWFIAISMCLLAVQKLQNIETFSTMFLNYDLLAKRWVPYSYLYPFAEGFAGILMLAGALSWLSVPVALVIGGIGVVSVYTAVYIEKRELKCACVGGDSQVPLGFVSLTENVMMVAMALWMIAKSFAYM
ncbi:MAG: glutaredoxin [Pseudomonadota bacterium]